jgi:hypothetical protein
MKIKAIANQVFVNIAVAAGAYSVGWLLEAFSTWLES